MRTRRATVAGLLAALVAFTAAPAAAQDGPPRIDVESVDVTPGRALLVLDTADLPEGDTPGVHVTAAGERLAATATPLDTAEPDTALPARAVMLLLDTSGSMEATGIAAAQTAATGYLDALPPDVRVGLVTFADRPALAVAPSAGRDAVVAALGRVVADGDTALYDAVGTALSALEDAGFGPDAQRRLVVLSDGVDTSSTATLDVARDRLAAQAVPADIVAFRYGEGDTTGIDGLARAARGRVLTAEDAPALSEAFTAIARSFERRVAVAVEVPDALAGRTADLVVELGGARVTVPVRFAATGPPDAPGVAWPLVAALAAVFLAVLLGGLLVGPGGGRTARRAVADRIGRHVPGRVGADGPAATGGRLLALADRALRAVDAETRLAVRLDLAGSTRTPGEWFVLGCAVCAALAALLTVVTGSVVAGVLLGVGLGWAGLRFVLGTRIARRRAAFADQFPEVLQLVAGSLRSGFSLAQALAGVVRQDVQPAAGEIARALAETRIGVDLEVALDRVAGRMASPDLQWTVMTIRIQRETGGNLAEVLLTTMVTMRERAQMRRQVRVLSAEGRISAYILVALPIVVGGWLFLTRPEYMRPLYTTTVGVLMLAASALLIVAGAFWMRRLIAVEV